VSVIPSGFGQANIVFSGGSLPTGAEVTLGFENTVPQTAAACATAIRAAWATHILDQQVTAITLDHVLVKLGPNATGPSAISVSGVTGSINSAGTSPAQALLVRKHTALGGRRHRGRMYVPGFYEGNFNSAGAADSTWLATMQTSFNDFYAAMITAGVDLTLLHADGVISPTTITSLEVEVTMGTQRRRQRR